MGHVGIQSGSSIEYVTKAVDGAREGYYTSYATTAVEKTRPDGELAGEPPLQWYGQGAEQLGLSGEVDHKVLEALMERRLDPRTADLSDEANWKDAARLASVQSYQSADQLYGAWLAEHPDAGPEQRIAAQQDAQTSARQNVAFFDCRFSADKEYAVAWAACLQAAAEAEQAGDLETAQGWRDKADVFEESTMAGSRAMFDWFQQHADYTRINHGDEAGRRWVDGGGLTAAQALQHDNRNHDPDLHVHGLLWNYTQREDGSYRTLDGQLLHQERAAAAAVGSRAQMAFVSEWENLPMVPRQDGHGHTLAGVDPAVVDLFSSRSHEKDEKVAAICQDFFARYGREPVPAELHTIKQQAVLATRAWKSEAPATRAELLDRWAEQTRETVQTSLAGVAKALYPDGPLVRRAAAQAEGWSPESVQARVVHELRGLNSNYTRSQVIMATHNQLPANLGVSGPTAQKLVAGVADRIIAERMTSLRPDAPAAPDHFRNRNGESQFVKPGSGPLTDHQQLIQDIERRSNAYTMGAPALSAEELDGLRERYAANGRQFGEDQWAAVAGILGSGSRTECLQAAAGSGKTFTVGAAADAWRHGPVVGVTPSQKAAEVLTAAGVESVNSTRWLMDQAPLPAGALVICDEAAMMTNDHVSAIQRRVEAAGGKLLLVGDTAQVGAVGAGGAFADMLGRAPTHELTEVRRFHGDGAWQGPASLGLRAGDLDAVRQYHEHGALRDGGTAEETERAAARAYLADTLAGKHSLLLTGSHDSAGRMAGYVRDQLIELGQLQPAGVPLPAQGTFAGPGDLVRATRNGWALQGFGADEHDRGGNVSVPINGQLFRVTGLREDGGMTVAQVDRDGGRERLVGQIHLPKDYVDQHLHLGYAGTVHSSQGDGSQTCHEVIGNGTDAHAAYVGLSRGAEQNTAWAVTRQIPRDGEPGQALEQDPTTAQTVLKDLLADRRDQQTAMAVHEQEQARARSIETRLGQLVADVREHGNTRTTAILDRLTVNGVIDEETRGRFAAAGRMGAVERVLRTAELAGHDPEQVLTAALDGRDMSDANKVDSVLHHRITSLLSGQMDTKLASAHDLIPGSVAEGPCRDFAVANADGADERRHQLGAELAQRQPAWLVETLGAVPEDVVERQEWEHKAGWAGAARELTGWDDDTTPLGPAPPAAQPEKAAYYREAHRALGLPDPVREEEQLSDEALYARWHAWEVEQKWAPEYVGERLAATAREQDDAAANVTLWQARVHGTDMSEHDRAQLWEALVAEQARTTELAAKRAELERAHEARTQWFLETAVTRDLAVRAGTEAGGRNIDLNDRSDWTTAEAWEQAHREHEAVEDQHRDIDTVAGAQPDEQPPAEPLGPVVETDVADIRDVSQTSPTESEDPAVDVPDSDQVDVIRDRSELARLELEQRQQSEQRRLDHEAAQEAPPDPAQVAEPVAEPEPALEPVHAEEPEPVDEPEPLQVEEPMAEPAPAEPATEESPNDYVEPPDSEVSESPVVEDDSPVAEL